MGEEMNSDNLSVKNLTIIGFALAVLTIISVYFFQYVMGYQPCELCYAQRNPYYVAIPILLLALIFWSKLSKIMITTLVSAMLLVFLWSTFQAGYHAGVEWGFWPGPNTCSGMGDGISLDQLNDIDGSRVVPCDRASVRFFGLSFAGMNTIVSIFIAAIFALATKKSVQKIA